MMKLFSIIKKSIKEQIRNFWILILTISLAPFFVIVWYMIDQGMSHKYEVTVVNYDKGIHSRENEINYGTEFIDILSGENKKAEEWFLSVKKNISKDSALNELKNKNTDMVLIIPNDFSLKLQNLNTLNSKAIDIEFIGDLTDNNYLMAAIWTHNYLTEFISYAAKIEFPLNLIETGIGTSATRSEFDLYIPGLLIFAIIMLMFSASIAIVVETEKQTLKRIKISKVKPIEFLGGISIVQIILGIVSILLTLIVAVAFGFQTEGSFLLLFLIAILSSISIIAFSLILAALSKTVNAILVVGNFPLFLFMFFTGAMFPLNLDTIFTIGGYEFNLNFILSPVHGISALKKVLIFEAGFTDILPELITLVIISIIYCLIGIWLYKRKHLCAE